MKKWLRTLAVPFLVGAIFAASVGLLEGRFKFTFPQAVILVSILFAWWAMNRKLDAINKHTEYLHTATNGLVLPRLTRVERRQRGWNVPEPPTKKNGEPDEYDDWETFCAEPEVEGEEP